MHRWKWTAVMLGTLAVAVPALGDWKAPADGVFSEDQLTHYIDAASDWAQTNNRLLEAISNAKNDADKMAAVQNVDQARRECLERHQLGEDEYNWIAKQTVQAWTVLEYLDYADSKSTGDLQTRYTENQDKLREAQDRMEQYQRALDAGERVLTTEERGMVIQFAKDDHQAALDEVKLHQEEAATARKKADEKEEEASEAEDHAKNPPPNITDNVRDQYIQGQIAKALAARQAMKDELDRASDAQNAAAKTQAEADARQQQIEHPEIPITDDEKAVAKDQCKTGITQAQSEINSRQKVNDQLEKLQDQIKKTADELKGKAPEQNLELLRKYSSQYKDMLNRMAGVAATQPSH